MPSLTRVPKVHHHGSKISWVYMLVAGSCSSIGMVRGKEDEPFIVISLLNNGFMAWVGSRAIDLGVCVRLGNTKIPKVPRLMNLNYFYWVKNTSFTTNL